MVLLVETDNYMNVQTLWATWQRPRRKATPLDIRRVMYEMGYVRSYQLWTNRR